MPRHPADGTCAQRIIDLWPQIKKLIFDKQTELYDMPIKEKRLINEFDAKIKELKKIA